VNTQKESKIKNLLDRHSQGTVLTARWLEGIGISHDLQKIYRKSQWLESIGTGAFKRYNDPITWAGGLYAIQKEATLPIHAGALTALSLQGLSHYLRTKNEIVYLFSQPGIKLPKWFSVYQWGPEIEHIKTSLLPEKTGLTDHAERNFSIVISAPERAMLECLYLSPKKIDLLECYQLMEGLTGLRPKLVQELLQQCTSVKVKRLFLFMADKAKHRWLDYVDLKKVDLGTGDRSITKGGLYNSKYRISIPKELA
jgi:Transcriptional regulator, AbiEi antitoxin, Type IV TA system/Transcriptional regulator, AbiEi antitoxin N-terminal domain